MRTASRKFFPALNFGTLTFGMLIFCFVAGLIPLRAERSEIQKIPNPVMDTFSPFLRQRSTILTKESKTRAMSFLLNVVSVNYLQYRNFLSFRE